MSNTKSHPVFSFYHKDQKKGKEEKSCEKFGCFQNNHYFCGVNKLMTPSEMTDEEIIKGLISRDNSVAKEFFFVKCRPLFCSIIKLIFGYKAEYDELVNDLYLYLMKDDAVKLRNFKYQSSVYQWLKVVAIRFFLKERAKMIEESRKETPYNGQEEAKSAPRTDTSAECDLERLLKAMPTKRYVHVLRRLVLEDCDPKELAQEMKITTANLYNIKLRAITQLTRIALIDIKAYGK